MLLRPTPAASASTRDVRAHPRWPLAFVGAAGVLGAAGVAVGAAGTHMGGGDLTRTASDFLLFHAAALLGAAGVALALRRASVLFVVAMASLAVGAALFGGELALAGLFAWRPVPLAAPIGGFCLIAGWLLLAASAATLGFGGAPDMRSAPPP